MLTTSPKAARALVQWFYEWKHVRGGGPEKAPYFRTPEGKLILPEHARPEDLERRRLMLVTGRLA